MIIEIKYVSEHGSIVQLVGKFKDSGKVAAIGLAALLHFKPNHYLNQDAGEA